MTRSCTSRGLSPPGGRKSRPLRLFRRHRSAEPGAQLGEGAAFPVAPSHLGQARSMAPRRGRAAAPSPPPGRAGSVSQRKPASSGGRRQSGTRLGIEPGSARPCSRPASFHAVGMWRISASERHAARACISIAIDRLQACGRQRQIVVALDLLPRRPAESRAARRIGDRLPHRRGKGGRVAGRRQQPGDCRRRRCRRPRRWRRRRPASPLACASSSAMPKASLIAGQTKRSASRKRAAIAASLERAGEAHALAERRQRRARPRSAPGRRRSPRASSRDRAAAPSAAPSSR